jgi:hypothetical protein
MKVKGEDKVKAAKLTFTRRTENKETERLYKKEKHTGNKL